MYGDDIWFRNVNYPFPGCLKPKNVKCLIMELSEMLKKGLYYALHGEKSKHQMWPLLFQSPTSQRHIKKKNTFDNCTGLKTGLELGEGKVWSCSIYIYLVSIQGRF